MDTKLILTIAGIIVIPCGVLAGTWGYIKRKVSENTKWLNNHEARIQEIEQCTERIETILEERIPKDLGERIVRIETKVEDLNNKKKRR